MNGQYVQATIVPGLNLCIAWRSCENSPQATQFLLAPLYLHGKKNSYNILFLLILYIVIQQHGTIFFLPRDRCFSSTTPKKYGDIFSRYRGRIARSQSSTHPATGSPSCINLPLLPMPARCNLPSEQNTHAVCRACARRAFHLCHPSATTVRGQTKTP